MTKKKETSVVHLLPNNINPTGVSIVLQPDKELIDTVMHGEEIFARTYGMGYWARGVEPHRSRGWLLYEHGGEVDDTLKAPRDVMIAWRTGLKLPPKWFRLDRALALRAQAEAVKLYGIDYRHKMDLPFYDTIIQLALFNGEEKYG